MALFWNPLVSPIIPVQLQFTFHSSCNTATRLGICWNWTLDHFVLNLRLSILESRCNIIVLFYPLWQTPTRRSPRAAPPSEFTFSLSFFVCCYPVYLFELGMMMLYLFALVVSFFFRMIWAFDVQVQASKQRGESAQVQLLFRRFGDCRSRHNFSFQLLLSLEMWALSVFVVLSLHTHTHICIAFQEL